MNKYEEKSAQTKAKLCDAFMELYRQKSIEHISIKEITNLTGCNRATFYLHFLDIYDLLEKIENELLTKIKSNAADAVAITDSTDTLSPALYFKLILEFYNDNEKYFSVLMGKDVRFVQALKEIIRPALFERLNDKSTVSEAEMEYIIEYQISAVIGVLNLWVARDRDIPVEKMTQIIVQISSGGVLPMVQGKIKEQM